MATRAERVENLMMQVLLLGRHSPISRFDDLALEWAYNAAAQVVQYVDQQEKVIEEATATGHRDNNNIRMNPFVDALLRAREVG